jgi:hypothetical protein
MNEERFGMMEAKIDTIVTTVEKISVLLNGTNGDPGLKTKVDRNTRSMGTIKKFFWVVATAIVGVLATIMVRSIL